MDDARRIYAELIADHRPQPYVTIVREIRALTPDVTIVRAVAGRCELFQTTPAAFHGPSRGRLLYVSALLGDVRGTLDVRVLEGRSALFPDVIGAELSWALGQVFLRLH